MALTLNQLNIYATIAFGGTINDYMYSTASEDDKLRILIARLGGEVNVNIKEKIDGLKRT